MQGNYTLIRQHVHSLSDGYINKKIKYPYCHALCANHDNGKAKLKYVIDDRGRLIVRHGVWDEQCLGIIGQNGDGT